MAALDPNYLFEGVLLNALVRVQRSPVTEGVRRPKSDLKIYVVNFNRVYVVIGGGGGK
jgi:hypothetical protein